MLTKKIRINLNNQLEDVSIDDMFISSDLLYITGSTSSDYRLTENDVVWISTPYTVEMEKANVSEVKTVNRKGFILHDKELEIKYLHYYNNNSASQSVVQIAYVEHNGIVYYQEPYLSVLHFVIDGETYVVSEENTTLLIKEKLYIEDNKAVIDDKTYYLSINANNEYFLVGDDGLMYVGNDIDYTNIDANTTQISKFRIDIKPSSVIKTKSISRFGWLPYIIYNNHNIYFEEFYNESDGTKGFGPVIDGVGFNCDSIYNTDEQEYIAERYDSRNYLYYSELEGRQLAFIMVEGSLYEIFFEPSENLSTSLLSIETQQPDLPVMVNDILTVYTEDNVTVLEVKTDDNNLKYISLNGKRYSVKPHICDKVNINNDEFLLTYSGDSSHVYVGMLASTVLNDGEVMYFMVESIDANNQVTSLKKVVKLFDSWENALTMQVGRMMNTAMYTNAPSYLVTQYEAIDIDGIAYPIEQALVGSTYKEIINLDTNYHYRLKVVDMLGSNKIICTPYVLPELFPKDEYDLAIADIVNVMVNNTTIIEKSCGVLGFETLEAGAYIVNHLNSNAPNSTLDLSGLVGNITIAHHKNFFNIPISLNSTTSLYDRKTDTALSLYGENYLDTLINAQTDMEKDVYTPIYVNKDNEEMEIESIQFNLHFRTRDLESWKIIEDEGKNASNEELSLNSPFCNWFITDYYPYNQIPVGGWDDMMSHSDLMGFLYFTTQDIQEKRTKVSKSFLRLTYYTSKNPLTQKMLGTSTIFFDCDRFYDILNTQKDNKHTYFKVCQTLNDKLSVKSPQDKGFDVNLSLQPTVLNEVFDVESNSLIALPDNLSNDENLRLDSRLEVFNRYENTHSSEGFYPYILKYFAKKTKVQKIYMKMEFFHAGTGVKIPMILPTDKDKNAITTWTPTVLDEFKEGYDLSEVYDRLYIPLNLYYSKKSHRFVYTLDDTNRYLLACLKNNKFVFNIFELKTKTPKNEAY